MVSERPENGARVTGPPTPATLRPWCNEFLAELSKHGNVRLASKKAKVHFTKAYRERRKNPVLAEAWEEAKAIGLEPRIDRLEDVLLKRASDPNDPHGAMLLRFALANLKRERYSERLHHKHEGGEAFGRDAVLLQERILAAKQQRIAAGQGLPDGN